MENLIVEVLKKEMHNTIDKFSDCYDNIKEKGYFENSAYEITKTLVEHYKNKIEVLNEALDNLATLIENTSSYTEQIPLREEFSRAGKKISEYKILIKLILETK